MRERVYPCGTGEAYWHHQQCKIYVLSLNKIFNFHTQSALFTSKKYTVVQYFELCDVNPSKLLTMKMAELASLIANCHTVDTNDGPVDNEQPLDLSNFYWICSATCILFNIISSVASADENELLQHLVFKRLVDYDLVINAEKFQLGRCSLQYLGQLVSTNDYRSQSFKRPRWRGRANIKQRFITHCAKVSAHLTHIPETHESWYIYNCVNLSAYLFSWNPFYQNNVWLIAPIDQVLVT